MRRLVHLACVALLALIAMPHHSAEAQHRQVLREQPALAQRHELKLNLLTTIFQLHPKLSYEYLITHDMTVGSHLSFQIPDKSGDFLLPAFQLAPTYRWYFRSDGRNAYNTARGFFLEAYSPFSYYKEYDYSKYELYEATGSNTTVRPSGMTWGLGVALGWKLLTNHGWSFDIYGGLHRNFVTPSQLPEGGYNMGLTVGKRF